MENFTEIDIENCRVFPHITKWKTSTLYKLDANGKIRMWEAGFDGEYIHLSHGLLDGQKIPDRIIPTILKTNDDVNSRAFEEIKSKYKEKIKKCYTSGDPLESKRYIKPMLANLFDKSKRITFPIYTQYKLDGIRGIITYSKGEVEIFSRNNTSYNHISHIRDEMSTFLSYLPERSFVDGEFYIHGQKLQTISSIVNKGNKGGKRHELLPYLKYYIFDIDFENEDTLEVRYEKLLTAYYNYLLDGNVNNYFCILGVNVAYNLEDIDNFYRRAISLDYEGIMIKKICSSFAPTPAEIKSSMYMHHRVNNILKYKRIFDEEGTILKILDCKGREEGNARFEVRDPRGNIFYLKFDGNFEKRKKLMKNSSTLIGKKVTYKYGFLSNDGIPMHSHGICIREDI